MHTEACFFIAVVVFINGTDVEIKATGWNFYSTNQTHMWHICEKAHLHDHKKPITWSDHMIVALNVANGPWRQLKIVCKRLNQLWLNHFLAMSHKAGSRSVVSLSLETLKLQPVAWIIVVLLNNEHPISFCDGSCAGFPSVFLRDIACSSLHQNEACMCCMTLHLGVYLLCTVVVSQVHVLLISCFNLPIQLNKLNIKWEKHTRNTGGQFVPTF